MLSDLISQMLGGLRLLDPILVLLIDFLSMRILSDAVFLVDSSRLGLWLGFLCPKAKKIDLFFLQESGNTD